ncbi:unnamed protein product [Arabis nemorensis]|uniref:Uncharacterized protein n=1 Tax=Arabis nemorensis TaxID=586526 RepID=A0A565C2D0_9BRAS|nr:unnamed protein product [Arabis nemorensis]
MLQSACSVASSRLERAATIQAKIPPKPPDPPDKIPISSCSPIPAMTHHKIGMAPDLGGRRMGRAFVARSLHLLMPCPRFATLESWSSIAGRRRREEMTPPETNWFSLDVDHRHSGSISHPCEISNLLYRLSLSEMAEKAV